MDSFEKGTKTCNGLIKIVDLHGTWREMGRQYGALLAGELGDIYERAICGKLQKEYGMPEDDMKLTAQKFFAKYPFKFKEVMRGIAETSGLSLAQVQLVNAVELISAQIAAPQCTGIAVWGDYSAGSSVFGRNYDWLPWFREFSGDLAVAAWHPADGTLAVATIGYAGEIYVVNGINEKGIFLELNNGMPSGGALWYDSRVPAVAELFQFLLDCETLDEIDSRFQTTKANFAYIVGVADGQMARCYEWPVFEVKRRTSHSRPGLTVLTNHFTELSWGLPRPDDKTFWMTRTRRQNMLNLAKHLKGTIDASTMKKMMETRIEDLGSMMDLTVYQIVAVPGTFEFWLRLPGAQDWTSIDMRELLAPREA